MISYNQWQLQFRRYKTLTARKTKLCAIHDVKGRKETASLIENMARLPDEKREKAFHKLMDFWERSIKNKKANYRDLGMHIAHAAQVQPRDKSKTPFVLKGIELLGAAYSHENKKRYRRDRLGIIAKETAENMMIIAKYAAMGKPSPLAVNTIIDFLQQCNDANEMPPDAALFEMIEATKNLENSKRLASVVKIVNFCIDRHEEELISIGDASHSITEALSTLGNRKQKIIIGNQITKWALYQAETFPEDDMMAVNKAQWLCDVFNNACSTEVDNDFVSIQAPRTKQNNVRGLYITFKQALNNGQGSVTIQLKRKPGLFRPSQS